MQLDPDAAQERATGLLKLGDQPPAEPDPLVVELPYRPPMRLDWTLDFLRLRAIPGVERSDPDGFRRSLGLPHGAGWVELAGGDGHVRAVLRLADHRDLAAAVARLRRLLDLDADPQAVDAVLAGQPALADLVRRRPGLRSPGAVDGFEMAVRAVVGQQISVAGARTVLGWIVREHGSPAFPGAAGDDDLLLFPAAETIAGIDPTSLPMPAARGRTIVAIAAAMASGELVLDAGADRTETRRRLLALPGVGPWTADYLLMRALGDPDVYLATDLGVRKSVAALGDPVEPAAAAPWRSYLTHHLWAAGH